MKATDENGEVVGIIHAQQENPVYGREGTEKWVITNIAVVSPASGKGVGSQLLEAIEAEIKKRGGVKLFVHTNVGDNRVIRFYYKNGYKNAGTILDYYYAGSAVFLLKSLGKTRD